MRQTCDRRRARRWGWLAAATAVGVAAGVGRPPAIADGPPVEAAAPSTQPVPSDDAGPRQGRGGGRGEGNGRRRGSAGGALAGGRLPPGQAIEAERGEALKFVSQHAPKLYGALQSLPEGDPYRNNLEAKVTQAYVNYQRLRPDDPALFDVIVKRVESDDLIFGLANQVRHASGEAKTRLRQELRQQVKVGLAINLQERKLRLARLERTLKREQDQLAADAADTERLVDARLTRLTTQGEPAFPGGGGHGRGELDVDGVEPTHGQTNP